jgi:hypothetical protein
VFGGNTPYEIRKNIRYEEVDTVPAGEKFRQVFGPCGLLHFIIPFVPFEGEQGSIFGLKLFRFVLRLKFWTNFHRKTTDINLYLYCGQQYIFCLTFISLEVVIILILF